ncbi:MAG: SIR2 family protein [Cyclobacteriaceae bacterium]
MDKKDIPNELFDNFKKKSAALFVGAGLSIGSGLPSWEGLMEELIGVCRKVDYISKDKVEEYESLKDDPTKFLFLAEDLKVELGKNFSLYFEDRFVNANPQPTKNHELIAAMDLSIVLTINYDDLLEKAFNKVRGVYPNSFIYSESKNAANNYWKEKFFILKAHGDAKKDVETLILSQRDYRVLLYREPGYRSLLQSIFTTKSIVFLGVSFSDPEFNQLLDFLHDSYHGGGPVHYLVIEEGRLKKSMSRRFLDDFNIRTIPFNNASNDYSELTSFLELLQSEIPYKG